MTMDSSNPGGLGNRGFHVFGKQGIEAHNRKWKYSAVDPGPGTGSNPIRTLAASPAGPGPPGARIAQVPEKDQPEQLARSRRACVPLHRRSESGDPKTARK